jgi:putative ABC transport system permease protein
VFRLIAADLLDTARVWLGATLVAAVAAATGVVVAGDVRTGGTAGLALYAISGTVVFSAVTTLVVLGSVTRLAVTLHQRSYALWLLVGLTPRHVRTVVQAQLALVALVGGTVGCAAAAPVLSPLFALCFADVPEPRHLRPTFDTPAAASMIAYVLLMVVLGGARAARRAARTPALRALREPEAPAQGMSTARWLTGAAAAAVLVSVVAGLPGKDTEHIGTPLMLIGPLTA